MNSLYKIDIHDKIDELDSQYQTAKALIIQFHDGQVDGGGENYLNHLMTVSQNVAKEADKHEHWGYTEEDIFYIRAEICGLLHDILEDTDCTEDILREHKLDEEIIEAVKIMTHRDGESYFDYIKRVSENPISKIVKIADLENNMDVRRLKKFGEYEKNRIQKYWAAWKYLKGELGEQKALELMIKRK